MTLYRTTNPDAAEVAEDDDPLAGCCTESRPCPDHFDLVFEAYRDRQTDRYVEHGVGRVSR
jgi:hypothetical protein